MCVSRASPSQPTSTGHYVLAVDDATVDVGSLSLNQQYIGTIQTAYSVDRWTFSANAGQQIRFDLINTNSNSIHFQLTGPNGYTAFNGLTGDSSLITLPTSGNYVLTADALGGQAGNYAFRMQETTQTVLPLGTTYTGSLSGSGLAQLFKVTLLEPKKLFLLLDDVSNADRNELYVKFGSPPTRSDYQYKFDTPASADQELLIPSGLVGDWYVLLYSDSVPSPSNFTLLAVDGDLFISHLTPNSAATNTDLRLTISGAGFDSTTTVSLVAGK